LYFWQCLKVADVDTLGLSSIPGRGAAAMNSSSSHLTTGAFASDPTRKSVLVIADLELNAMLFDHLTTSGWALDYVADNEAALTLVKDKCFDLIITAEATSAKEDLDLLRRIRAVRAHTRMIILTGESTTQDVILALKQRAFGYFSKPYSFESLTETISMAMKEPSWDDGIEVISATPAWIRLLVRCDRGTAERMLQFFDELADVPEKERGQVAYAFREMLLNAMRHGAGMDPSQYVEISYLRTRRAVACRVKDPGQGFTFDELYHAAVSNPIDNPIRHLNFRDAAGLPAGGYGILLSRHLVDELIHNEQGNEVLLVKYLNKETSEEEH
jgi:anti-sigma regulatory factor (Ser/Thr protein kinase)/ActR/RegA family two-component response regulator